MKLLSTLIETAYKTFLTGLLLEIFHKSLVVTISELVKTV